MRSQHDAFNKPLRGTVLVAGEFRGRAAGFSAEYLATMPTAAAGAESISVGRRCPDGGDCG
jgi:hypothetical protein